MGNGWTPERRAKQSALIQSWQPWKTSTGPRTPEGKHTASQNREKSLEAAEAQLAAAKARVKRLHGGKEPLPDWVRLIMSRL